MVLTAQQIPARSAGSTRNVTIDYQDALDSGEVLSGTPTIAEVTTTDLTLSNKAVSTAALTVFGRAVAIGQAVQFTVAGGSAGTTYTIRVTVSSDGGQTFVDDYTHEVM